jgi:RNA polymerase sigma factor (sigma-70 family)
MLFENLEMQLRLRRIVIRFADDAGLYQDLMQEAMIHLWHLEEQDPSRNEAWYLQGCRFHLQNSLRQGRSVDSLKHFRSRVLHREQTPEGDSLFEPAEPMGSLLEEVSVNDSLAELCRWLTPPEQETLLCLMEGLTARESAKRLNVSHTLVNRHRSHIAKLALKLGIAPSRTRPRIAR